LIRASQRRTGRRDEALRQEHDELAAAWHVRPALADRLASSAGFASSAGLGSTAR
jgi:hypothetical protein